MTHQRTESLPWLTRGQTESLPWLTRGQSHCHDSPQDSHCHDSPQDSHCHDSPQDSHCHDSSQDSHCHDSPQDSHCHDSPEDTVTATTHQRTVTAMTHQRTQSLPWLTTGQTGSILISPTLKTDVVLLSHQGSELQSNGKHSDLPLQLFGGWLLNVPVTCKCISGTDLLTTQAYVLQHRDKSCRSNFLSHLVTADWQRANQPQRWPYNARPLAW